MSLESRRKEIHDLIIKWLDEEGVYKIKSDTEQQGMHYVIKIDYQRKDKPSVPFAIQCPTNKKDLFQAVIRLEIPRIVIEKLAKMDEKDRNKFDWDLTVNIIRTNCYHQYETANNGTVKHIDLWEEVYFDGTNKDRLIQAIRKIFNGYSLVSAQFEQLVGEPRPRPDRLPGIA